MDIKKLIAYSTCSQLGYMIFSCGLSLYNLSLLKLLPNSYISILIASLSLCGFPFLSGFFSKDLIIEFSFLDFELDKIFCFWLVYCCAFITMLYSIKLLFLIFYSKFNYYKSKSLNYIYEGGLYIYISQIVLLLFSIFSGYFFKEIFIGFGNIHIYNSILQLPKSISFFEVECFIE